MVPSSLRISQITDAGSSPARWARSQPASVWPARISTPPFCAVSGKMWPGVTMSSGRGVAADGHLHGARAVVRRDAGGDAGGGLDRDGEGGAVRGAVVAHHLLQAELAAALVGERQADQAAAVLGHEVDRLGGDEFGRHHEVTLVLAVLFVYQDDHLAGLDVGDDVGDRRSGSASFCAAFLAVLRAGGGSRVRPARLVPFHSSMRST